MGLGKIQPAGQWTIHGKKAGMRKLNSLRIKRGMMNSCGSPVTGELMTVPGTRPHGGPRKILPNGPRLDGLREMSSKTVRTLRRTTLHGICTIRKPQGMTKVGNNP